MADGIHATAIISKEARLARDVRVGPYSVVGAGVEIAAGCSLGSHVTVGGPTSIGENNSIFQFASIGAPPQDLKYAGEDTRLEIGTGNTIREFATLNRGTVGGGGTTRVGDNCLLMAYSHVAHDCTLGDGVVMANAATLAGHVTIEDYGIVGGLAAIHQHVRIGSSAILGGGAMATLDVPPFCMAAGDRARLQGLNVVGLRRRGLSEDSIRKLRKAYRTLFQSSLRLSDAVAELVHDRSSSPEVGQLLDFVESSERGICR